MKTITNIAIIVLLYVWGIAPTYSANVYKHLVEGRQLSRDEAEQLEEQLIREPDDMVARTKLIGRYHFTRIRDRDMASKRHDHIFWFIENAPYAELLRTPLGDLDGSADASARPYAKELWGQAIEAHPDNAEVLANAASFLFLSNPNDSLRLYVKAEAIEPDNPEWKRLMAHSLHLRATSPHGSRDAELSAQAFHKQREAYALAKTPREELFVLTPLVTMALDARMGDQVNTYARKLLERVEQYPDDEMAIDAYFRAHEAMGLVALQQNDVDTAKTHLLKSAQLPGSDPLMRLPLEYRLAQKLLDLGERAAVREFLKQYKRRIPEPVDMIMDQWIQAIDDGEDLELR